MRKPVKIIYLSILCTALLIAELRADGFSGEHGELFTAVRWGTLQELKSLVAQGKNIHGVLMAPGSEGWTLLHEACHVGKLDVIEYLLLQGLDVNVRDNYGETPLMRAGSSTIQYLLSKGADPFAKSKSGKTLLHYAAGHGLDWFVEYLIAAKIDPNANDQYGWTPLHFAAAYGNRNIVEILISKGADLKAKTNAGETLIHLAIKSSPNADLIQFLIQNGADVNTKLLKYKNMTLLHYSVRENWPEIVRLLLTNGADPNIQNTDYMENTPLYTAVQYNFIECAKILLEHGADPNIKNRANESPAELAIKLNYRMSGFFKNK